MKKLSFIRVCLQELLILCRAREERGIFNLMEVIDLDYRQHPLHQERDPRGRCCPPGRGCNIGSHLHQPCHMMCVEMHSDQEAIESVRYWWRRWRSLRWWKFSDRKEALGKARQYRNIALASPPKPPPPFAKTEPLENK